MRFHSWLLATVLAACASTDAGPYPAAQEVLDEVAARHPGLVRLTLHAVPAGGTQCTQLASTMPERRGRPSDPEDLEAMQTGHEVVLDEPGAVDVTVAILRAADGKPTAVAGVTLRSAEGTDRDALIQRARSIAGELAAAVQSAGKPLW